MPDPCLCQFRPRSRRMEQIPCGQRLGAEPSGTGVFEGGWEVLGKRRGDRGQR